MSPLTDIYQVDPIPYNARAWYINDWSFPEIYSNIAAPVAEAFKELFGGQAAGLPNDTLVAGGAGPFSYDGSFCRLWLSWRRSISGPFLHPLNFYQYIDISGTDTSQWKLLKIFDTTESFLEALHNGSLKRSPLPAQEARLGPYFTDKPSLNIFSIWMERLKSACRHRVICRRATGTLIKGTWEATMGRLHDHVINYKVDLDVAGTANSLLKTTTSQEAVTHPWFNDDWGSEVIQRTIRREYITNENDALLKLPGNFQGGYSVVNQEEKIKWGTVRGYAIHPGYSPIHTTVVGSKHALNNVNWARYNLAVSRRKETEPSSSSVWNFNLPAAPPVDFHKFFDGENITQQDLVVWVNVGTHHLPESEDAPNTQTNTATSSFFITPLNYFDYDVSIDSTNAILLQAPSKEGEPFSVDDYGVRPVHCIPQAPPPFEYAPVHIFDRRGGEVAFESVEAMRGASELYHRITFGV
ncbi:copper amine oxidase [Boletus edulis BED1]|uniref:Amine oxidase n=1 Tax=Boletus edulis BED1 TaxID=1328754 RepID=A0AAD4BFD5_BOLED|nr:copper amine oxidase [Boletus edulis BED1]